MRPAAYILCRSTAVCAASLTPPANAGFGLHARTQHLQTAHGTGAQAKTGTQQSLPDDHCLGEQRLDHHERQHGIPFDVHAKEGEFIR